MAGKIAEVIATYQNRLLEMPSVPKTSYVGVANKLIITFLFSDPDVCIQFLKDVGLIRLSLACTKCGCEMTWCVDASKKDGFPQPL
jgi:hypothetical protein